MSRKRTSYKKRSTTKIIRVEHIVGTWLGQYVVDLRLALDRVPGGAVLTDIEDRENGDEYLVFEAEEEVQ